MKKGTHHTQETILKIKKATLGRKPPKTAFKIGFEPWNKGLKTGLVPKTAYKKGDIRLQGENHHNWKGDNASYYALHLWVSHHKGKAKKCEICGTKVAKKYEWANKSFEYKRNLSDWMSLCNKCHRQYDLKNGWGKAARKYNLKNHIYG